MKDTPCEESENAHVHTLNAITMNWKNLKDNKCPKCNKALKPQGVYFKCSKCDFTISGSKFNEIIKKLYFMSHRNEYRDIGEEENFQRLNNL